jgi:predicted transcriptional regulator
MELVGAFGMNEFERIAYWLLAGSKGGINRARILSIIMKKPMNSNQLSEKMKVDYKTIAHHVELLEKNGLVYSTSNKYGKMFFPSQQLESSKEILDLVKKVMKDE